MTSRKYKDCHVNAMAITIHVTAYFLFLVSLVYFYLFSLRYVKDDNTDERKFGINVNIRVLFASLSQICLCYVFWHINK
jgi:hypothetical protein